MTDTSSAEKENNEEYEDGDEYTYEQIKLLNGPSMRLAKGAKEEVEKDPT